ncbi:MAG: DNRLRE domain-containing protein [Phycisphaerales bacterium]|nr:DNRLRE domain-containing protein [Phycisphaerales bacterium]
MTYLRAFVSLSLLACSGALADVVSLTPVADNTLYFNTAGNSSNGKGTAMFAGNNASLTVSPRRALVLFDVASAVPPAATVVGASLTLTENGVNFDEYVCTIHRVTKSWGEGASVATGGQGGGGPAQSGDATWLFRFFPGSAWTNAGGDFNAGVSASLTVGGGAAFTWTSAQLAADVKDMAANPSANFGWMVRGDESLPKTAKKFSTREDVAENRPTLTIRFFPTCLGDLNADTLVEDTDFVVFAGAYNTLDCADPSMPAGCPADLNFDGFVDDTDFVFFASAYNDLLCP